MIDAGRWVGQGAVLVHEGPEVFPDVGLGGVVLHGNIMAAEVEYTHCDEVKCRNAGAD